MLMLFWLVSCLEGSGADKSSGKYPQVFLIVPACLGIFISLAFILWIYLTPFLPAQNRK